MIMPVNRAFSSPPSPVRSGGGGINYADRTPQGTHSALPTDRLPLKPAAAAGKKMADMI